MRSMGFGFSRPAWRGALLSVLLALCLAVSNPLPAAVGKSLHIGDSSVNISVYGLSQAQREAYPKVALALSGGGARGLAHIPVIEAIERAGIPIDLVVGTSMGSLIGGLYAAGYSPSDLRRLLEANNLLELFVVASVEQVPLQPEPMRKYRSNLVTVRFDMKGVGGSTGLIGDQRILTLLNDTLSRVGGITDFDELAIPFRCVGTDAVTGAKVVFSHGSLVAAIRSSIAIPIVFTPYPTQGRYIFDGGLVDNLPIDLAKELGADIVIAVDVNASDYEVTIDELTSVTEMLGQLLAIMTKNTVVDQLEHADLVINPDLSKHGILDFFNVEAIIEAGNLAAAENGEQLRVLSQRIAIDRPLQPQDPHRYGPYFSLPDVYVASVSHVPLFGSPTAKLPFNLKPFQHFVGLPLDNLRKKELEQLFEEIRYYGQYATILYDFEETGKGKSGQVQGNLTIKTRAFEPKPASIGLGAFGTSAVSFNADSGQLGFYLHPSFSLDFTLDRIPASIFGLGVSALYDGAFQFRTHLDYPSDSMMIPSLGFNYAVGGLHPANTRTSVVERKKTDRLLSLDLGADVRISPRMNANIHFEYQVVFYGEGDPAAPPPGATMVGLLPKIHFQVVYSDFSYGFFPWEGTRADLITAFGGNSKGFDYQLEARLQQAFPFRPDASLCYDLHVGFNRSPYPLAKDYLRYGGVEGMAGYLPGFLVDEMLLARLGFLHRLREDDIQVYLRYMLMFGASSRSTNELIEAALPLFAQSALFRQLRSPEAGASIAIGLSSPIGDLLFGFGANTSGRFALFVEVR
jgi:NTE family protein